MKKLLAEIINRSIKSGSDDLPIVVVLGPPGQGKTYLLDRAYASCNKSTGIPTSYVKCGQQGANTGWEIICRISDGLQTPRRGVRVLRLSRMELARLAVDIGPLPPAELEARQTLVGTMRDSIPWLGRIASLASIVVSEALSRLGMLSSTAEEAATVVSGTVRAEKTVRRVHREALEFYGTSLVGQLQTLVALNRQFHGGMHEEASEVALRAIIADLRASYKSDRRTLNCAVFLDNIDKGGASNVLTNWARFRAGSNEQECDPAVIISTSRTRPDLVGLTPRWAVSPHSAQRDEMAVPRVDAMTASHWGQQHRGERERLKSWWYPGVLRGLAGPQVAELVGEARAGLIHRLSAGHPEAVLKLNDAVPHNLAEVRMSTDLHRALDESARARLGLEAGARLGWWLQMASCSVARSPGFAINTLPAGRDFESRATRHLWLARRGDNDLAMHPWMRNTLLHVISEQAYYQDYYLTALRTLRSNTGDRTIDAAYYDLALGNVGSAVDYLVQRIDIVDARHWINELNSITSAPSKGPGYLADPEERYDLYMEGLRDTTANSELRSSIFSLVVAQWIWSDPFGDPEYRLVNRISRRYADLTMLAPGGRGRYEGPAIEFADKSSSNDYGEIW